MTARIKALPVAQNLVFTGTSTYRVAGGLLVSQRDVWDAVNNNDYLSVRFRMAQSALPAMSDTATSDVSGWPYRWKELRMSCAWR